MFSFSENENPAFSKKLRSQNVFRLWKGKSGIFEKPPFSKCFPSMKRKIRHFRKKLRSQNVVRLWKRKSSIFEKAPFSKCRPSMKKKIRHFRKSFVLKMFSVSKKRNVFWDGLRSFSKSDTMATATRAPPNKGFIMSRKMVPHVRLESWHISLRNSNVKWPSCTYFGERQPQWIIFPIFFWNWTRSVHFSLSSFLDR